MPSKAFLNEYFEDAYRDAAKKRREVLDRGLLLIAHLIREELPTATAISVNASALTAVHDGGEVIWRFNDDTRHKLNRQAVKSIRLTLLDMTAFNSTVHPLLAADWKPVDDLLGTLRVDLPEHPDRH